MVAPQVTVGCFTCLSKTPSSVVLYKSLDVRLLPRDSPLREDMEGQPTPTTTKSKPTKNRPPKRSKLSDAEDSGSATVDGLQQSSRAVRRTPQATASATKNTRPKQPLSCGECRRLKLKCDRVFPCQACVRRGCEGICPDGILATGKGTRYVLASTEQLHKKIFQMSDRIRALEEGLEKLQMQHYAVEHPLLKSDLLLIKTTFELYGLDHTQPENAKVEKNEDEDPFAGDVSEDASQRNFFGPTAEPEFLLPSNPEPTCRYVDEVIGDVELARLATSTPATWLTRTAPLDLRKRLRYVLPPRHVAVYLCEQLRKFTSWQYIIVPSTDFEAKLIEEVYSSGDDVPIRSLALIYCFLMIGAVADADKKLDMRQVERYQLYARVALCEGSIIYEPDMNVLRSLFMIIWCLFNFMSCKQGSNDSWAFMGVVAKVVQSLGFHRQSNDNSDDIIEQEERRLFFWELVNLDTKLSLTLGRPPSFSFVHSSPRRPTYLSVPITDAQYHSWKHDFLKECLHPLLELSTSITAPEYSDVLQLDNKIRDFAQPKIFDESLKVTQSLRMQRTSSQISREIALLQLHRSFFSHALADETGAAMTHRYSPSIVATFRSACRILDSLEQLYAVEAALSSRFAVYWFNGFSAIVALCLLVSRNPSSALAPRAIVVLDKAKDLYNTAAKTSYNANQVHIRVNALVSSAKSSYTRWRSGTGDEADHTGLGDILALVAKRLQKAGCIANSERDTPVDSKVDYWRLVHPSLLECYREVVIGTGIPDFGVAPEAGSTTVLSDNSSHPEPQETSDIGHSVSITEHHGSEHMAGGGSSSNYQAWSQLQGHISVQPNSSALAMSENIVESATNPTGVHTLYDAIPQQVHPQSQPHSSLPPATGVSNVSFDGTVALWNGTFRTSLPVLSQPTPMSMHRDIENTNGFDLGHLQLNNLVNSGIVPNQVTGFSSTTSHSFPLSLEAQYAHQLLTGTNTQQPMLDYSDIRESSHTDPFMFNEYSAGTQWFDWL